MPSTTQGQSSTDVPSFPRLEREYDENPARFLIHRIRVDAGDGTNGQLIFARIRGIDSLELANAWAAVERRLAAEYDVVPFDEPREDVLEALQERRDELADSPDDPVYWADRHIPDKVVRFVDDDGDERDRSTFTSQRRRRV